MSTRLSSISVESVVEKSSTVSEKHTSWRKKKIISSFFKKVCRAVKLPFCCSQDMVDCLPQLDPQFDNSTPDINKSIPKESVERLELLSLSSQDVQCLSVGTYIIKRGTVGSLKGWNDHNLSSLDSFQEEFSFMLPGEVPVEPVGASSCLSLKTVSRLDDSTPDIISEDSIESLKLEASVSKTATEERRRSKGIHSFFKRVWKAMKRPFHCQNKVEPFVSPLELDEPEPSPVPESLDFVPTNKSIRSRYIVKKIIGEGGYGKVYEGIRTSDGKKVAIKRIRKTRKDQYLQIAGHPKPLITEVALLLMMRQEPISPHIIQLYEWFEHPRKFTLIMEYPDPCESLWDFINDNPPMNEATARVIMRQAVYAVQHCIEHGVFHNDIHPDNILLRKHTLELKLIDFGCGHLLSSKGYDCRQYRGIRAFFPPEVFIYGKFHAVSTNVWALGVLLYEMMNMHSPFCNRMEIMQTKVRFNNPNLSKECRDLIVQCLTHDPTERPTLEQILQHDWFQTVDLK